MPLTAAHTALLIPHLLYLWCSPPFITSVIDLRRIISQYKARTLLQVHMGTHHVQHVSQRYAKSWPATLRVIG
jgi:predicted metal-binding protein